MRLLCLFSLLLPLFAGLETEAAQTAICKKSPFHTTEELLEAYNCQELPIGETRVVSHLKTSPTNLAHKYILERTGPDHYKIKLNLRFSDTTHLRQENPILGAKIKSNIAKCLKQINPQLRGFGNQKLEIELIESDKNLESHKLIEHWIAVSETPVRRAHSALYDLDLPCSIITHELFHLTGLPDEYVEMEDVPSYRTDCRAIGPEDSIMFNEDSIQFTEQKKTSLNDLFSQRTVLKTCVCKDPKKCREYSDEEIEKLAYCPGDYKTSYSYTVASKNGMVMLPSLPEGAKSEQTSNKRTVFYLSVKPSARIPNSILYPAHVRAILYPGCKTKNETYYSCAVNSYHRPLKLIGSCGPKPPKCSDPQEWLK